MVAVINQLYFICSVQNHVENIFIICSLARQNLLEALITVSVLSILGQERTPAHLTVLQTSWSHLKKMHLFEKDKQTHKNLTC
jgi:hypothetical protein